MAPGRGRRPGRAGGRAVPGSRGTALGAGDPREGEPHPKKGPCARQPGERVRATRRDRAAVLGAGQVSPPARRDRREDPCKR